MDIERLKKVTTIQEFFQITNKETISDGTKEFLEARYGFLPGRIL